MSYDWIALLLLVLSHQYPGPRRGHTLSGPQKTVFGFCILLDFSFWIFSFFSKRNEGITTIQANTRRSLRTIGYRWLRWTWTDTSHFFLDFAFFSFFVQQSFFSKWNEDIRTIQVNTRRSLRTIDYR